MVLDAISVFTTFPLVGNSSPFDLDIYQAMNLVQGNENEH